MLQNAAQGKDVGLAIALAQGKNVTEAAAAAGVNPCTVYRKLARLRQQYMSAALGRVADGQASAGVGGVA